MARAGISARCTSSATTCFPSSSAERSLKEVPALRKGVRKPATIATRRPGRKAMETSWECGVVTAPVRRVKKVRPRRRARPGPLHEAVSTLLFAQLQQVIPGAGFYRIWYSPAMLRSSLLFQAVALPYEMLTRHPVWERDCARMALELPAGARRIIDLGCGPGSSTRQLPPGAIGGDHALSMLRRARKRAPGVPLVCLDAASLPVRTASLDAVTFHSVLYLLPEQSAALREA